MLCCDGLVSGYGQGVVLDGLSLSLAPGEVLGLLGRNGAGKSTLLKTVMGLLPLRGGALTLDDQSIADLPPYRIARLGLAYVPQGRGLFGAFSVEENLKLGNLARTDRDNVTRLFPVLEERRASAASSLSGGQQQQLAVARALLADPTFLLLDEPSEGVQPSIVLELGAILRDQARDRAMGILLVEQNIELTLAVCDRVAVIEKGRVVAEETAEALRRSPDIFDQYLALA